MAMETETPSPSPYSAYPDVETPVPVSRAFEDPGEIAAQTQAAILLAAGGLLGSPPESDSGPQGLADSADEGPGVQILEEEREGLEIPEAFFELANRRPYSWEPGFLETRVGAGTLSRLRSAREYDGKAVETLTELAPSLAERACEEGDPEATVELVGVSLLHPQPLVRVSAAAAAVRLGAPEPELETARRELSEGAASDDPVVNELARTALSTLDPENPVLRQLTEPAKPYGDDEPSHTSLLVHGTWARQRSWWQPEGDFHTYLKTDVRPDLYSASDRFDWTGGYSDPARSLAADRLEEWVESRNLDGLDLFCHSHGGSVAMEATQKGLSLGKLVLLSCPVHRGKYDPAFQNIAQCVVSIRVRLDLVILLDGGGQRFRDPNIRENRLPVWFKHSATHRERVWEKHDVPNRLGC